MCDTSLAQLADKQTYLPEGNSDVLVEASY